VAHDVAEQPLQEEPPVLDAADFKSPPPPALLKLHADISRSTAPPQLGHIGNSS
jgi:hypothetical protein